MTSFNRADLRRMLPTGLFDPLSLAPPTDISEREFTALIITLAQAIGWRVAHFRPAQGRSGRWCTPVQGDGAGWPDLVLVRDDRLLVAELKTSRGQLSPQQRDWLRALNDAGVTACVWRPADWQVIVGELTSPTHS